MEGNNNKAVTIIGVVVIVALLIGGIVWLTSSNQDAADTGTAADTTETSQGEQAVGEQDIVALASATADLSTLVAAIQQADLVATLQGEGPFTVFAPTNDAFAALPDGTLDTLLEEENKDQLASILTYHVVAGEVMAADLSDGQVIETVQGGTLTVSIRDGSVYLQDATGGEVQVITPDIKASNGVVHIINGVVLPE